MIAVSVVIAALNASGTLGEQLDALTAQSLPHPFEILVCDNGSTDGTRQLVEHRCRIDPRIRLIDASDRPGSGHARNIGVAHAHGDILAFCDADDVVTPGWLATIVNSVQDHSVVVGRAETVTLNRPWTRVARALPEGIQQAGFLPFAGAGNLAMTRQTFNKVKGFDTDLRWLEDVDLSWRLQLAGFDLTYEPEAVVHVRLRHSIVGIFTQGAHYGYAMAQLERRYQRLNRPGWPDPTLAGRAGDTHQPSFPRRALGKLLSSPGRGGWGFVLWQLGWHLGYRGARHEPRLTHRSEPHHLVKPFR
jgi:glycosyltransferase involved in cell wall biosynthesis